ncbi:MAG: hypothetical protein OXH50_11660, partial [Gemmatimonadetes bacterium]|nr:hypothetical protein [Gemmatimonadota bacterium]
MLTQKGVYDAIVEKTEAHATAISIPLAKGGIPFDIPETAWMRMIYHPATDTARNVSTGAR